MTAPSAEKSALRSLTLQSAVAVAVAYAAHRLGFAMPEGAAQEMASVFFDLIATLGLIGVAVGRARARGPIV